MRPAHAALGAALCVALGAGCGDALDAPPASLPQSTCPHIDEALEGTLGAISDGEVAPLAAVLEDLSEPDGDDAIALALRTVLALVSTLGPIDLDTDALGGIDPDTIADLEAGAARALAPFIAPEAGTPEANDRLQVFDALAEAARVCPEGSLTGTLRALAGDEALLDTLLVLASDQRFIDFFAPLLDPASGEAGRRGVVTLLDTLFDLLAAEPFDFQALAGVFGLIIDEADSPMREFLAELQRALVGEPLDLVQASIRCIQAVERTDSIGDTHDGADLLGDALYDILLAFGPDPSALLDQISGDTGGALALVDQLAAAIQSDPVLRQNLLDLIDLLFAPERLRPVLEGAAALLEAGALQEIAALLQGFLGEGCDTDPDALTETLVRALAGGSP